MISPDCKSGEFISSKRRTPEWGSITLSFFEISILDVEVESAMLIVAKNMGKSDCIIEPFQGSE